MPDEPLDLFAAPEPKSQPMDALDLPAYRQRLAALAVQLPFIPLIYTFGVTLASAASFETGSCRPGCLSCIPSPL